MSLEAKFHMISTEQEIGRCVSQIRLAQDKSWECRTRTNYSTARNGTTGKGTTEITSMIAQVNLEKKSEHLAMFVANLFIYL